MTEDDFISLVNPDDQQLIQGVVLTLDALRIMDRERLSHLLTQVQLAKPYFPKEMLPSIESLEIDFTLALAFIEQAKKYDKSKHAVEMSESLFGRKDKKHGTGGG